MGLKQQILSAQNLRREAVEVPEWGVTVTVQEPDAEALEWFYYVAAKDSAASAEERVTFRTRIVARCLLDEDGNKMFTPEELLKCGGQAVMRVYRAVEKLSVVNVEAQEELEKNSETSEGAASTSSPSASTKRRKK